MKMKLSRWTGLLLLMATLFAASSTRTEARQVRNWPGFNSDSTESMASQVRAFQYLLGARGYKIVADGNFGRQTESALRKFQRARGLQENGVVDEASWEALPVRVRSGSKGDAVRAAQTLLRLRGYRVAADGVFGAATNRAVQRYQRAKGLIVDGIVGLDTWCSLFGGTVTTMSEE